MRTFETTLFLGGELNFDYSCLQTINGTYAVVAEWLRRWTRNPLGSARTGSNPVGSELFYDNSSPSLSIYPKHLLPVSHRIYKRIKSRADVAEWLRRWTWNPLGSARTGSNPVVSEGFLYKKDSCENLCDTVPLENAFTNNPYSQFMRVYLKRYTWPVWGSNPRHSRY